MSQIDVPLSRGGFGQTQRADNWWVQPLVVFLGLSAFIAYSTWAALQGQHFPHMRVGSVQTHAGCLFGLRERCSFYGRRAAFE